MPKTEKNFGNGSKNTLYTLRKQGKNVGKIFWNFSICGNFRKISEKGK